MHSLIFASNSMIGRFGLILSCFSVSGHVRTVVLEINVRRQDTVLPRQHENALFFLASLFLIWNQLKCNWISRIREHRYRDTAPIKALRRRTRRCGLSQDIDPPYPLFPHQSGLKSLTNMFNQREQTVLRVPALREWPKCLLLCTNAYESAWESLVVYVLCPSLLAGDCWALGNEYCTDFLLVWFSICYADTGQWLFP